jgi:CubicO group peptidase (beta-lactamase class C family)
MNLEFRVIILIATVTLPVVVWSQTEGDGARFSPTEVFEIAPVRSFLVRQGEEMLVEEYVDGMHADRTTNIKSASKAVISLLIGIAIEEGYLNGIDQPIGRFFPEYFAKNPDSRKEAITIGDLLTMRAGLESTSRRNYGRWVLSENWTEFALGQPFTEEPGGRMIYSTGSSHLLSVILTKATGTTTRTFAENHLFGPMGITVGGWDRDPQGYYMGGNNLALSPSSLMKIGVMVMNNGLWQGQQIVPADWIADSLDVYTRSNFNPYNFGYLWWQRRLGNYDVFFAWGSGGQYIMMLPALETVIAITSGPEEGPGSRADRQNLFAFLEEKLIPFLESRLPISSS